MQENQDPENSARAYANAKEKQKKDVESWNFVKDFFFVEKGYAGLRF